MQQLQWLIVSNFTSITVLAKKVWLLFSVSSFHFWLAADHGMDAVIIVARCVTLMHKPLHVMTTSQYELMLFTQLKWFP